MSDVKFDIEASSLIAVSMFVGTDSTKPVLTKVLAEKKPSGLWLVATDSRSLLALKAADHESCGDIDNGTRVILPPLKQNNALGILPTSKVIVGSSPSEQYSVGYCISTKRFGDIIIKFPSNESEYTYPLYGQIVKDFAQRESTKSVSFNPTYIAKFSRAFSMIAKKSGVPVTMSFKNNRECICVTCPQCPDAIGALMPIVGSEIEIGNVVRELIQ